MAAFLSISDYIIGIAGFIVGIFGIVYARRGRHRPDLNYLVDRKHILLSPTDMQGRYVVYNCDNRAGVACQ